MVSTVSATHTPEDPPVTSGEISKHKSLSPDIISKYLVQYVPVKPNTRSRTATRVSGSRVLTSAEGLLMLQEKEEKKKNEVEEKERKKTRRKRRSR